MKMQKHPRKEEIFMNGRKIRLIMLCGIPGSGKSTFAETYFSSEKNTVIISRDAIRLLTRWIFSDTDNVVSE